VLLIQTETQSLIDIVSDTFYFVSLKIINLL